ncbi:SGNH/GDSL hydrolase family protein [Pseudarthrobacter sp. NPDC092424]|uniref:SGNH/GDSL hydrolase family protein n=1 Tax=Pseudarthrobacter sp. NPDC092424 TaxID=3364415 RepID=UPI00382DC1C7
MENARRRHPALAAFLAALALALGFTAVPAEAAPPPKDVDYVAVGDSYTAGTGAAAFVPTPPCTQTAGGYVDHVDAVVPVSLAGTAACHGALLVDSSIGVTSVQAQIGGLMASGRLSRDTELVSITAGANDIGVSAILYTCATSTIEACTAASSAAAAALPAVHANLVQTFAAIQSYAPRARIAVLGYPMLFDTSAVPIIPTPAQALVNGGTAGLNLTIASAAATAKNLFGTQVQYVDVTGTFAGHAVNSTDPWIFLDSGNLFDPRNFHPNADGHDAYADALLASVSLKQLARA